MGHMDILQPMSPTMPQEEPDPDKPTKKTRILCDECPEENMPDTPRLHVKHDKKKRRYTQYDNDPDLPPDLLTLVHSDSSLEECDHLPAEDERWTMVPVHSYTGSAVEDDCTGEVEWFPLYQV